MLAGVLSRRPKSGSIGKLSVITVIILGAAMLLPLSMLHEVEAWSTDPTVNTPVCTTTGYQGSLSIVSDGSGGAIIIWVRGYYAGGDIYAQRIDSTGALKWAADGVAICTAEGHQSGAKVVSDGSGGAIIAWHDYRSSGLETDDIYAQRVNADGVTQWADNGTPICTAVGHKLSQGITSDGSGGAIIAWENQHSSSDSDVYAQRVNAAGAAQWADNGTAICTAAYFQSYPALIADGSGGAIITWEDYRSSRYSHIYAQRIDALGVAQWTDNGVAVCLAAGNQISVRAVGDGSGGAIIAWQDGRSGEYRVYAQSIDLSGTPQWANSGMAVCTFPCRQESPGLTADGTGGAIITWQDRGSGNIDCYAQKVDSAGTLQWAETGVAVCTAMGDQWAIRIVGDGSGGAIITWEDRRSGFDTADIYAQRVGSSGTVQWTEDGIAVCTAEDLQFLPAIVCSDSGGAILTWLDRRNDSANDIYAQAVNAWGGLNGAAARPNQPTNLSPQGGALDVSVVPSLQSSAFSTPALGDTHAASQWQTRTSVERYISPTFDSGLYVSHLTQITLPSGTLNYGTTYHWRVRYQDSHGAWSSWSQETSFTTLANFPPYQPANLFPVDGAIGISTYAALTSSEFSDPENHAHGASQWQMRTASGSYVSPVYDSGATGAHLTSITTPPGTIGYSSTYYWRVRYQDNHDAWSSWSNETSFTTVGAPQAPQDYWAVIIGISSYQDPASNIRYADDDAQAIYDELAPAWGEDHMLLLTDGDAAKSDISDAILNWLDPLEDSDDVVLIFFAGHGAQADGHEYLVPWDGIGIRDDEFAGWVGQLESENIVVILGSCLSGGFIAELAGGGRVVLTASRADESAWQTLELGHSSFGFYLLEALDRLAESDSNHNNQISAEELFGYAQPRTVAYMASFGISQHPQMYDPYAGELVLFNTAVVTLDMSPYVASLTVDGVEYEASELPRSFVFIEGTTHTVSAPTIVEEASQETRYSFASWSDNYVLASRIIVIDGPTTYTANYKIEHHLDVGSEWGDPQGAGWYEEGQTATFSVSPLVEKNEGSRLTFTGWSGDSAELTYSSSLVMDGPMSVEANWKSEHMLTVESEYGNPQGGGWYADGTIATFSVSPILDQGEGSRYAFTGWSGDLASTSPSSSVAMDEPKVVRANWALQYRLSISVSPPGLVTIRGDGWYDAGATAWTGTAEGIVTSPAEDTIFRFAGWIVDGSEVQGNRVSVVMSSPHTLLADYDVQYLLLVKSKSGDPVGTGWYESGSTATISVTSPEGTVIRKVFAGWSGDSHEMTPTATVIMDGPKTVTANWRTDYIQAYVIVGAAAGLIAGGLAIVILVRRARRRPAG